MSSSFFPVVASWPQLLGLFLTAGVAWWGGGGRLLNPKPGSAQRGLLAERVGGEGFGTELWVRVLLTFVSTTEMAWNQVLTSDL